MTDKEKTEEDKFRQILQDACSFSDEQLLRDLEKAEKALGEFEFSGAEERIFKKLMEREAINTERMRREEGEEKAAEKEPGTAVEKELKTVPEKESKKVAERVSEVASQKEPEAAMIKATGTASVEASEKTPEAALQTTSEENADKALGGVSEKISEVVSPKALEAATVTATGKGKVLRFGRRKRMLMVALAAAFVGMLGAKAVGGNSYFFSSREKDIGIVMNNGRNHRDIGDLNEAYEIASQKLDIKILRLGYIPKHMKFIELNINENKAVFVFRYEKVKVHFFQIQRPKETSFNSSSDNEKIDIVVHNKWIDQDAYIREEVIDSQKGYSALITTGDGLYRITGEISEDEMKQIVESLNFY